MARNIQNQNLGQRINQIRNKIPNAQNNSRRHTLKNWGLGLLGATALTLGGLYLFSNGNNSASAEGSPTPRAEHAQTEQRSLYEDGVGRYVIESSHTGGYQVRVPQWRIDGSNRDSITPITESAHRELTNLISTWETRSLASGDFGPREQNYSGRELAYLFEHAPGADLNGAQGVITAQDVRELERIAGNGALYDAFPELRR